MLSALITPTLSLISSTFSIWVVLGSKEKASGLWRMTELSVFSSILTIDVFYFLIFGGATVSLFTRLIRSGFLGLSLSSSSMSIFCSWLGMSHYSFFLSFCFLILISVTPLWYFWLSFLKLWIYSMRALVLSF